MVNPIGRFDLWDILSNMLWSTHTFSLFVYEKLSIISQYKIKNVVEYNKSKGI